MWRYHHRITIMVTLMYMYVYMYIPTGVIKHARMENPRTEWRLIGKKIMDKWSIFQQVMFDYQSVSDIPQTIQII